MKKNNLNRAIKKYKNIKLNESDNIKIVSGFEFLDSDISKLYSAHEKNIKGFDLFSIKSLEVVFGLFLAILIIGGTTVYAAVDSRPNDLLYSVKINVNEKVKTIISDDENDAVIAIDQISDRYREALELVMKGEFNAKSKNLVEAIMDERIQYAESKINKVKTKNKKQAEKLQVELAATIAANIENVDEIAKEIIDENQKRDLNDLKEEGQKDFEKASAVEKQENNSNPTGENTENEDVNTLENDNKDSDVNISENNYDKDGYIADGTGMNIEIDATSIIDSTNTDETKEENESISKKTNSVSVKSDVRAYIEDSGAKEDSTNIDIKIKNSKEESNEYIEKSENDVEEGQEDTEEEYLKNFESRKVEIKQKIKEKGLDLSYNNLK